MHVWHGMRGADVLHNAIIQSLLAIFRLASCRMRVRLLLTVLQEKRKTDDWFLTSYKPFVSSCGKNRVYKTRCIDECSVITHDQTVRN